MESELDRALDALRDRVETMVAPLRRQAADDIALVESRQGRLEVRAAASCVA